MIIIDFIQKKKERKTGFKEKCQLMNDYSYN